MTKSIRVNLLGCLLLTFVVGFPNLPNMTNADEDIVPIYQRQRSNPAGSTRTNPVGASIGFVPGGAVGAFPWPLFHPPMVAGSWYERPYPEHLEYFRLIQQAPRQISGSPYYFCMPAEHEFSPGYPEATLEVE